MALAHAGLGVTSAGLSAMYAWESSKILVMQPGQVVPIGGLEVGLLSVPEAGGPNYTAEQGHFALRRGDTYHEMISERRSYPASGSQTTEAAIESHVLGNYYIAIGERQGGGLVVRLYHHPLVGWIWGGALMMAFGGLCSLADRRFRIGLPSRITLDPGLVPA